MREAAARDKPLRCAIYTRKSTEQGLEQEFNSLDAQKEACAAYITSQRHEGWTKVDADYDDGGFSGGSMERPALQRLLRDIRDRKVNVIVVYKVDRLTRSLAHFSKIVEVLDAAGASFVSVTQAFNTTTSMGRLTLNVLLSFAQFEREVTGERIRDKIAASRARGMWMGGVVPFGYDVVNRKLVVNDGEAETLRLIFRRYLVLGSVVALEAELRAAGITSRKRISRNRRAYGGTPLGRGALYLMLENRIYVGEIGHKGVSYPGEHEAIIDSETFAAVAAHLKRSRTARRQRLAGGPSLLSGLLRDGLGRTMSPNHAAKGTRRYRYYFSRRADADRNPPWRVPAGDIEELILGQVGAFLSDAGAVHDALAPAEPAAAELESAIAAASRLTVRLQGACAAERSELLDQLLEAVELQTGSVGILVRLGPLLADTDCGRELTVRLTARTSLVRAGSQVRLLVPPSGGGTPADRDPALIKLLVKASLARQAVERADGDSLDEIAERLGHERQYFGVLLRLSWLSPRIVAAILEGRQPATLTRQRLARMSIPLRWDGQERCLGIRSH
ncbi:MAG: recombinase family protein [Sphingomicrobium sp.]